MLETTGQKPTNKNILFEEGKWWYVGCHDGSKRSLESHIKKNKTRMFVDGEYIPKTHPLHKPGRYKGFTDAAFSSLKNYEDSKQGQVYILRNPAFPSWCKIGMAVDAQDRLKQYQTSSPYRDYEVVKTYSTDDRRTAEADAHALLEKHYARRGEWFVCDASLAITKLDSLFEVKQLELF